MQNKYLNIVFLFVTLTSFLYVYSLFKYDEVSGDFNIDSIEIDNLNNYEYDVNIFGLLPDGWISVKPKSSMRYAEFVINNEFGSFSLIVFKNIGGGKEKNIERWYNQFSGENHPSFIQENKTLDVEDIKITYIQTSGKFNGGMGQSNPIDMAGMVGFIIEAGLDLYFFKAVASMEIIEPSKEDLIYGILNFPLIKNVTTNTTEG